jgi:hypothetical protein
LGRPSLALTYAEPRSQDSLPPCGGGLGWGVEGCGTAVPHGTTPTPDPSPQGGGEEFAALLTLNLTPMRVAPTARRVERPDGALAPGQRDAFVPIEPGEPRADVRRLLCNQPAEQDRPRGPRRNDRHCPRHRHKLPGQSRQGMANRGKYYRRGDFRSTRKGGKVRAERLSGKAICDLVKRAAGRMGLDAAADGAHSLRAGFLTSAARRGASVFKMRDVSRHKSMDVLGGYVRDANLFEDHAGSGLL